MPGELALLPTVSRSLGYPGRRDPSFRKGLLQSLDTLRADPRPVEVEAFEGLQPRQRLDRGIRQLSLGQRQVRWTPLSRPESGDPSLLFRQALVAPTSR